MDKDNINFTNTDIPRDNTPDTKPDTETDTSGQPDDKEKNKKKRMKLMVPLIIGIALAVIIVAVILITKPFNKKPPVVDDGTTAVPTAESVEPTIDEELDISFVSNSADGGTVLIISKTDSSVTLGAYANTGYKFIAWSNGKTETEIDVTRGDETVYSAIFEPIKYKVVFNGNSAVSGNLDTIECVYDQTYTLPKNAFEKPDFRFAGWSRSADGNVTLADGGKFGNLTLADGEAVILYAVWVDANSIYISVTANVSSYGTVSGSGIYKKGDSVTISATPAAGYKFYRWSDGATAAEKTITATADASYIAEFKADETVHTPSPQTTTKTPDSTSLNTPQPTSPPQTAAPTTQAGNPYDDIEFLGVYYADITTIADGTTTNMIAATDGTDIYLKTMQSGIPTGIFVKKSSGDKGVYMINYNTNKCMYMKQSVISLMGMNVDELVSPMKNFEIPKFNSFAKMAITQTTYNGQEAKLVKLTNSEGKLNYYYFKDNQNVPFAVETYVSGALTRTVLISNFKADPSAYMHIPTEDTFTLSLTNMQEAMDFMDALGM